MRERTQAWFVHIAYDLDAVNNLAATSPANPIVIFHCQQAIEKAFKAVLDELEQSIPRIHDLVKLYSLLPDNLKGNLGDPLPQLEWLSQVYVETRYPGEAMLGGVDDLSEIELASTVEFTNGIVREVEDFLNVD